MSSRSIQCCVTVRGRVGSHWSHWLGGLELSHRCLETGDEVTDVRGTVPDQSALQGLLKRIWNLNLTVLSVSTSPGEPTGGRETGDGVPGQG